MTPLAHAIAVDSTLPLSKRRYGTLAKDIGLFDDLHFFDLTAVSDALNDLSAKACQSFLDGKDGIYFLPAPRSMFEWRDLTSGFRMAAIVSEKEDKFADVTLLLCTSKNDIRHSGGAVMKIGLHGSTDRCWKVFQSAMERGFSLEASDSLASGIYAMLAMINTPRVIGRRTHMPHAGLQRKLAAARGSVGKFPLRAWTEIVLEVRPPDFEDGEARGAWLSGRKALHFVRCHLRIRRGKLVPELVTAHWRGDAALGIKQSRYRLEAA
jgi:hypothetical protein